MPLERLLERQTINGKPRGRSMLVPVAYSESVMPALRLARSSRIARQIAKVLSYALILTIIAMAFAPWQQSVSGTGSVLAFSPNKREQVIESPIKGRIYRWGDGIVENALVQKGDLIAEVRDLDENYQERLQQQLFNREQSLKAAEDQLTAGRAALQAANTIVESYAAQVRAYEAVKQQTIEAQDAFIRMAQDKLNAEQQLLAEYNAALPQLKAEYERTQRLQSAGNISLQKLQEIERKYIEAQAKVKRAEAYVAAARADLEGKKSERIAKIEKAQVDIDYAEAALRKARADVSKSESDVAKANQEVNKAESDLLSMQVTLSRQLTQEIRAPFEGFLVRINPNLGTSVLKEGDPICTIVPYTTDRSVQIWLDGNDAPLVEPGRHVRLQFEGWPALQFSGWPSVAVGTFGGEVVSVDATDNGNGRFRVLVRPDPADEPWPDDRFLRQGVRANGWVLLNRVPLWFEVWRRLNGFPPVIDMSKKDVIKSKPPKLPK